MAQSYVRGNWRNSATTSPIIQAKSSHDLDMLRWLVGRPTRQLQAFGSLGWFTAQNAPHGSTERCLDSCAIEPACPNSGRRIYHEQRQRLHTFELSPDEPARGEGFLQALANTNYGRCVCRMDNDQCDHGTVSLEFEDGITASFSMDAFTPMSGRCTGCGQQRSSAAHAHARTVHRESSHGVRGGAEPAWWHRGVGRGVARRGQCPAAPASRSRLSGAPVRTPRALTEMECAVP